MGDFEKRVELAFPSPRKLFTPAVTVILVLIIIGFTLIHYAPDFTLDYLAVSTTGIAHGRIWQLVTYSFIDSCPWNLIFDIIVLLFIGSEVERQWRTGSFVLLWLIVSVTCAVVWLLVSLVLGRVYFGIGGAACAYGLIGTFGLLLRKRRFFAVFWTVEAQHLAWFLIGLGIILGIPQPITWIWVAGAGVAYLYVKIRWRIQSGLSTGGATRAPSGQAQRPRGFVDID